MHRIAFQTVKNVKEQMCLLFSQLNIGSSKKQEAYFARCGEDVLTLPEKDKTFVTSLFGEQNYLRFIYSLQNGFVEKIETDLAQKGVGYVTIFSQDYPKSLKEIDDRPLLLYYIGDVKLLRKDCLAVVGSRKLTSYGKRVTEAFAAELCKDFCIVSGLAYGVDTVAHRTTVDNGGKTIAVLGSGLLNVYPQSNKQLAQDIVDSGGLLVSEYDVYAQPSQYRFPQRNRIVAGLSKGVLVTQAGEKSGTFSTVDFALEDGRELFVVCGEVFDPAYVGCNSLAKRMQAALVTSPSDVYSAFGFGTTLKIGKKPRALTIEEQKIVDLLSEDKLHFDQIVIKSGFSVSELNFLLANLELKSIIVRLPSNYYQLLGEIK